MTHFQGWIDFFGLPSEAPAPLVFFVSMTVFFLFMIIPLSLFMNFLERKMTADLQARVGPNRVGSSGVLQGFADMLKMLSKSAHVSETSRERFWLSMQNAALYSTFAALPLGSSLIFVNSELNSLIPFVALSLYFVCQSLIGIDGKNIEELLLGFRSGFQFVSGLIPSFICVLTVGVYTGSLNWSEIAQVQNGSPFQWIALSNPFGLVTGLVFILSGMLMFQTPPFHQLDRGMRHRSASGLAVYRINQFYATLIWSVFSVTLFFGAWDFFGEDSSGFIGSAVEMFSVLLKACVMMILSRVIAKALPQIRMDQMTDFSWKVLTPISLVCFLGMTLWVVGVGR